VKDFFKAHYCPNNAILCIAGDFDLDQIKSLVEKWFGEIPSQDKYLRNLPQEPAQQEFREKIIERNVPTDAFYYAFKMPARKDPDYHTADIISDAIGGDKSSRLYQAILKKAKLVSEINAYITGSIDQGLFLITGKLAPGKSFEDLDTALWLELDKINHLYMEITELERLKNKIQTAKEFQEQGLLNRTMNLSFHELLGDANGINTEKDSYKNITPEAIHRVSNQLFRKENCSLLKVKAV